MNTKTRNKTRKLAVVGVLIAAEIIAGRFLSISLATVKIGFAFLPLAMIAILFGPVWSGAAAAVSDILIAITSGFGYFPPITISAVLTGVIYGIAFYRKPLSLPRVAVTVVLENVFVSLLLQTFWLTMISGKGFFALLPIRALQNLITCPLQIVCIRYVAANIARVIDGGMLRSGGEGNGR